MIFLDTSGIFALADSRDPNHAQAVRIFNAAADDGETFLLHNYVLIESAALIQRRLGIGAALTFLTEAEHFQIHWVNHAEHKQASALLEHHNRRELSLVDCMSFLIMGHYNIRQTLAFDADFEREGFLPYSRGDQ